MPSKPPLLDRHKSLNLPFVPQVKTIDVSFTDVKLTVSSSLFTKDKKIILRGLTGCFKSGELTAIMGPSGAGKSSLLNILTGFQTDGMCGEVMTNNKAVEVEEHRARKDSAFIMQEDHLSPFLTVQEVMVTAANLKLGTSVPRTAKQLLIDELLTSLSMSHTKQTRCNRLSGGERKRLSIALELIDNPSVLYLDEPTTGLDSSSSTQLVRLLSEMASQGKTIVCTIHQPSATLFEMFDHIYVLADGRCLYQGSPYNVVPYLKAVNMPCPQYHNPADFLLDVVSGEFGCHREELIRICESNNWRITEKKKEEQQKLNVADGPHGKACILVRPPSELYRISVLMKDMYLQLHRDWAMTYLRLACHMMVGALVGVFFTDSGFRGDKTVDNIGYLMTNVAYVGFVTLVPAALKFPLRLAILKKERFNNWYTFKSFFIAFLLVNTPVQVLSILMFPLLSFFLSSQLLEWNRLLLFVLCLSFTCIICEYVGVTLGTIQNPANAIFFGSVWLAVMLLFSGFAIFLTHMSPVFYYVSYLSFMRFVLEAEMVATYGLGRGPLHCPQEVFYCHIKFPSTLLKEMGFFEENLALDFGILSSYATIIVLFSYFWVGWIIKKR